MLESLTQWERLEKRLDRLLPEEPTFPIEGEPDPLAALGLLDFIPAVTPRWVRPDHLAALAHQFTLAETQPTQALVSVPPRHSKTETLLHAIVWWLRRHPEQTVAYITYADRLTKSKSRFARQYARAAGVRLASDAQTLNEWRTPAGGGALFTSIGGPFTGGGCNLLIVDDPHKDRAEAESLIIREAVSDWFRGTAYTRVEPGGSVIVCHTRWNVDDLIGRLLATEPERWNQVFLPAINDAGEALWPTRWPLGELTRKRDTVGPYEWASLYMGQPRPRGGAVFNGTQFFTTLPDTFKIGIGIDLAYSSKTYADYSVAVVLAESGGNYYVLDVKRMQVEAPRFAGILKELREEYPGARMLWHASGTEKGLADLLRDVGKIPITTQTARVDKFVWSQPVAAAWNARTDKDGNTVPGRVFLRAGAPWAAAFTSELMSFTGVKDRHDDQVDALASAFDLLSHSGGQAKGRTFVHRTSLDERQFGF